MLLFSRYQVAGESMIPTLVPGDRLLVNRRLAGLWQPRRGDIVLVHWPISGKNGPAMVKRIIGLPGEEVTIREGQVFINGHPLDEPYLPQPTTPYPLSAMWVLGPDEYFVMGDNRARSEDSRRYGPVRQSWIWGHAWYRYAPPQRRGRLTSATDGKGSRQPRQR